MRTPNGAGRPTPFLGLGSPRRRTAIEAPTLRYAIGPVDATLAPPFPAQNSIGKVGCHDVVVVAAQF